MDEISKSWARQMYMREILEMDKACTNEVIWMNGSLTEESRNIHAQNIERYSNYVSFLKSKLDELGGDLNGGT